MTDTGWHQLPPSVRDTIEGRVGPITAVDTVNGGLNHQVAAILHTADGAVFIKAAPADDRRSRRQHVEAAVNPTVLGAAPRVLCHLPDTAGWNILVFEALTGARHADLTPSSQDLPAIADALRLLSTLTKPSNEVTSRIENRWAGYSEPARLDLIAGDRLLHTDLRPDNILIAAGRATIIDWAWPTLGACWIDPASLALWMIAEGHPPATAETWMRNLPNGQAPAAGIHAYLHIQAQLWAEIAEQHPRPWARRLNQAARTWAATLPAATDRNGS